MAYQKAYFPMKVINLSQGYGKNSSTHKYSYALDLCGKDSGQDEIYAPFDCKIVKVYAKKGSSYQVWLESTNKIESPNGYIGYLTISIAHPTEIANMKVGTIYKQNELICHEGREGNASGNHIHLEVSKGKNCSGWDIVNGNYICKNIVKAEEYLFVKKDSTIKNKIYKGVTYNFIMEKENNTKYKTISELNLRSSNDTSSNILALLSKNTPVEVISEQNGWYEIKVHGFVSKKYIKNS